MTLLSAHELTRSLGDRILLDRVNLTISEGDRVGLIGRNGSGKSTLLRCLIGAETPDAGSVQTRKHLDVAIVEQQPRLELGLTVGEAILDGLRTQKDLRMSLEEVESKMASAPEEELEGLIRKQSELTDALESLGGRNFEHEGAAMLDALKAPPPHRRLAELSLGEQRRVALAVGLLSPSELLILDEPTNHLDVQTIEWLEGYLTSYSGGLLVVTHDRYFLDRVTTRIAELDRGQLTIYQGPYTRFLEKKEERLVSEARAESNRQRALRRELEWVRRSPSARTTKSKARLDRFETMAAETPIAQPGDAQFQLPHPSRIGKTILELCGIGKTYGQRRLVSDLDLVMTRGQRIGLVGPNGAGKTTLLRIIMGEIPPDEGTIVRGQNTQIVYADQGRTDLSDHNTVIKEVAGEGDTVWIGDRPQQVQTFLEGLLFDASQQRARVGTLSGGERTRVALAKRLRQPGNVLILDEPTNDLDLATLRVLEDALVAYPGCVLVVSHDRWFLNRVTNALLVFDGRGHVTLSHSGHADWRASMASTSSRPKVRPTRGRDTSRAPTPRKRRNHSEEQEFRGMEAQIMDAEDAVQALEAEVSDPNQIKNLGPQLAERLETLERLRTEVEQLYARWEELSELEAYG